MTEEGEKILAGIKDDDLRQAVRDCGETIARREVTDGPVPEPPKVFAERNTVYSVRKYKEYPAIYKGDTLVGVTLYKKGAVELCSHLNALAEENARLKTVMRNAKHMRRTGSKETAQSRNECNVGLRTLHSKCQKSVFSW